MKDSSFFPDIPGRYYCMECEKFVNVNKKLSAGSCHKCPKCGSCKLMKEL